MSSPTFAVSVTRGYIVIGAPVPTSTYLVATTLFSDSAEIFKKSVERACLAEWENAGKPPPGPPLIQLWQLIE